MIVWSSFIILLIVIQQVMAPLDCEWKRKRYLVCAGIVTAFVMGMRGDNYQNVYDLRVYCQFYERIANLPWRSVLADSSFETGFSVLCKLLSYISHSGQTIVIFEAIICVWSICYFIYHNTENVFEAFFFFVTLGTMGFMLTGLRQSIAIALILFSLEQIKNNKWIKSIILIALAVSIHQSALVFVPARFLLKNKIFQKHKLLVIPFVFLMMAFAPMLLKLGIILTDGDLKAGTSASFSFNGIVPILLYVIAIIMEIILENNQDDAVSTFENYDEYEMSVIVPMAAIGLGFYLMRFYGMVIERLAYYYFPAVIIGLANATRYFQRQKSGTILKIMIMIMAVYIFYRRLGNADYADYVFFWSLN